MPENHLGDGRMRRSAGSVWGAVAVSVAVHFLIAMWWSQLPESAVIITTELVLEPTIQPPEPPADWSKYLDTETLLEFDAVGRVVAD